jgi:hypothetical protein
MKLRAIVTAMVIALTTPALADISDYESMHRRLADVLGSRAQADAAYDKLMKEANTYGQPVASVVDLFIAVCTATRLALRTEGFDPFAEILRSAQARLQN